jgi:hypothetical protein
MANKFVSRAEAIQCATEERNSVLAGMIQRGLPLSRNAYIQAAFGSFAHWNYEKEAELPECFQDEVACKEMIADSGDPDEEDDQEDED